MKKSVNSFNVRNNKYHQSIQNATKKNSIDAFYISILNKAFHKIKKQGFKIITDYEINKNVSSALNLLHNPC